MSAIMSLLIMIVLSVVDTIRVLNNSNILSGLAIFLAVGKECEQLCNIFFYKQYQALMVGFGATAKTNFQHIPLKNLAKNNELKLLERNLKGRFPMQNGICKDNNCKLQ